MSELSTLVSLASAHNGYWTIYIAVAAAVIGYQSSGKEFSRRIITKVLLSAVFIGFAALNGTVLRDTDRTRRELVAQVNYLHESKQGGVTKHHVNAAGLLGPGDEKRLLLGYLLLDLGILLGIWLLPKYSAVAPAGSSAKQT